MWCLSTNVSYVSYELFKLTTGITCSGMYGTPKRFGKIKDLSKFDASFFNLHPKQVDRMDPQIRLLMEVAYEAIVDAG